MSGLKVRMTCDQGMEPLCLRAIAIDPLSDLPRPIAFEAHPDLQAAKASRLLKAMYVVLVAFVSAIHLVGQVRGLHPE